MTQAQPAAMRHRPFAAIGPPARIIAALLALESACAQDTVRRYLLRA